MTYLKYESIEMSSITKFVRQTAGSKKVFIFIVLLLAVSVLMENLLFICVITFIMIFLMVVDTVNWENVRRKLMKK